MSKLIHSQRKRENSLPQFPWVRFLIWVTNIGNHLPRNPSESDTHSYCPSLWEKIIEGVGLKCLSSTDQTLVKPDLELCWFWVCSGCYNCSSSVWWQSNVHTDVHVFTIILLENWHTPLMERSKCVTELLLFTAVVRIEMK